MNKKNFTTFAGLIILCLATTQIAQAQEIIVFPKQGQSEEQKQQDVDKCYNWAKGETGVDPQQIANQANIQNPSSDSSGGTVLGGAARGAAGGAIIGAVSGDAGAGAAVGAALGGLRGGVRQERNRSQQEQQVAQLEAEQKEQLTRFYNAAALCLENSGYAVNIQ